MTDPSLSQVHPVTQQWPLPSIKHSLLSYFSQQYFGKCSQEWLSESFLSPFPIMQGDVQLCKDTLFCLSIIMCHLRVEVTSGRDIARGRESSLVSGLGSDGVSQ